MAIEYGWDSFLWSADEFFVVYATLPDSIQTGTRLFIIGHVVELYLKAARAKQTDDVEGAIKKGHDLWKMWHDCKCHDDAFMREYELDGTIIPLWPTLRRGIQANGKQISVAEMAKLLKHDELYTVMSMLPDLKYVGSPLKTQKDQFVLAAQVRSDYWIRFLREVRSYLAHPGPGQVDWIRYHVEQDELPPQSAAYLQKLLA